MILFSSAHPDPRMAYVVGLVTVIEGLAVWLIGDVCRRSKNAWTRECAGPLFQWALILTVLAIPTRLSISRDDEPGLRFVPVERKKLAE